jgi:hypothetical protein
MKMPNVGSDNDFARQRDFGRGVEKWDFWFRHDNNGDLRFTPPAFIFSRGQLAKYLT